MSASGCQYNPAILKVLNDLGLEVAGGHIYFSVEEGKKYLNLGSGFTPIKGYINIDYEPQFSPDLVANIVDVDKLFEPESISGIVCIHTLQCLHLYEALRMLNSCLKILKPGGRLLLHIPCLTKLMEVLQQRPKDVGTLFSVEQRLLGFDAMLEGLHEDYYMAKFVWPSWYLEAAVNYFGYINIVTINLNAGSDPGYDFGWGDTVVIGERPSGELNFRKTNKIVSIADGDIVYQEEE
jgi:predicted SAM-dependent methyltransferase